MQLAGLQGVHAQGRQVRQSTCDDAQGDNRPSEWRAPQFVCRGKGRHTGNLIPAWFMDLDRYVQPLALWLLVIALLTTVLTFIHHCFHGTLHSGLELCARRASNSLHLCTRRRITNRGVQPMCSVNRLASSSRSCCEARRVQLGEMLEAQWQMIEGEIILLHNSSRIHQLVDQMS